jgi:hypothetical protein
MANKKIPYPFAEEYGISVNMSGLSKEPARYSKTNEGTLQIKRPKSTLFEGYFWAHQ